MNMVSPSRDRQNACIGILRTNATAQREMTGECNAYAGFKMVPFVSGNSTVRASDHAQGRGDCTYLRFLAGCCGVESAWSCEVDSGPSYVPIEASGAPRARGEDRADMAQGRTGHRPRTR